MRRAQAAAAKSRPAEAAFWPLLQALVREVPGIRRSIAQGETPEAAALADAVREALRAPHPRPEVEALGTLLGLR